MSISQRAWGRLLGGALALLALPALTACSSDYQTDGVVENGGSAPGYVPPAPVKSTLVPDSPTDTAADPAPDSISDSIGTDDALQSDDPLAADHGNVSHADPLGGDDDNLLGNDPLLPRADPLSAGMVMPTDHSHWLDGSISDARVTVELNHVPYGEFQTPIDKDITMHVRRGVNTVTFKFVPESSMASVRLQVEESEHDPPIPPLAVFNPPLPLNGETSKPVTQTFTFIAH